MTDPTLHDIPLVCVGCAAPFVFTAGQQAFFAAHGLAAPKRCIPCRTARRVRGRIGETTKPTLIGSDPANQ